MKNCLTFSLILMVCFCCKSNRQENQDSTKAVNHNYKDILREDYEVFMPESSGKTTVILFGGFPQRATDIKREFDFLKVAKKYQLILVYMNYNRRLWMSESDKAHLFESLKTIFDSHDLPGENVHIGGFSSGGNIALLLSNYMVLNKLSVQPKGVFVVDSPVDLLELYRLSERNIARQFSEGSMQEATFLIKMFDQAFGPPENNVQPYEVHSPFTSETSYIRNLANLDGLKIRFYSEPDTIWWKKNRNNELTDLNAYWIEKLTVQLTKELPNAAVTYITTDNKGYRSNGDRHPHSWSIVDQESLVEWILNE